MTSLTTTMATSPSTAATVAAAAAAAMKHSSSSAVDVESLSFSYKRHGLNLESINMHVPRGTIYGLLGPSGCGKTTLLRCIVGRLKPRCGNVSVFGYCPGTKECGIPGPNIGYMPQELSLISQFTVRETLEYYAGFAKQTSRMQTLESRIEFLLKLLDISDFEHCYTDRLSGGQQRRVSLAVAMINDPPLLILDEPTVGVDPIVRESIWSYLVDQSKNGLTVIVTTHYIEEAGSADKVGFMRQGRILAEGNPNDLMMEHGVVSMERLFLKLSQQDDFRHSNNTSQLENGSSFTKDILLTLDSQKNHKIINMNHHNHILHNNYVMGNGGSPTIAATIEPTNQSVMYTSNGGASMMAFVNSGKNKPNLFSHLATPPINNAVKHMIVHEQYKQLDPDSLIETNTISGNNCKLNNNDYNNQMDASSDSPLFNNNSSSSSSSSTSSTRSKKSNHSSSGRNNNTNKKVRTYSVHNQDRSVNSVQKVGVLCRKHRIRLFRRVPELVITMLLPALEVALFCLCMGRDPTSVQMAVCNQEDPPFLSLMFLKSIDSDFISLKYYRTPEEAIDSVRNADTYSAIVLGKNFSNVLNRFGRIGSGMPPGLGRLPPNIAQQQTVATSTSIEPPIGYTQSNGKLVTNTNEPVPPLMTPYIAPSQPTQSMLKTSSIIVNDNDDYDSENEDNPERKRFKRDISDLLTTTAVTSTPDSNLITPDDDDSIIRIYYDGSNALHVNIIRREVFSALFKFVENAGKIFGGQMSSIKLPIKFEKPIYGGEKTDMVEFVGPGLMVFIVFFATMSITSMAFLSERREGTLERSMIVGMTPTEFIIAQIINITILLIVQIILTVVMGFWIFDFPMKGSYVLAVAMMFLQGLCGMTFGLMLSAICTSEMTALALGAGSQLMFCFITGIFWPVETMIALLRYISYAMPQTKPMESFRHILIRGFDLSKPAVLNGYLITMAWIAFFLILAIVIFRVR